MFCLLSEQLDFVAAINSILAAAGNFAPPEFILTDIPNKKYKK
jgi:hypothetical protein